MSETMTAAQGGESADGRRLLPRRGVAPVVRRAQLQDGDQPQATVAAGDAAITLAEAVEDVEEHVGRDALARVTHDDLDVGVAALQVHLHASVPGRELRPP